MMKLEEIPIRGQTYVHVRMGFFLAISTGFLSSSTKRAVGITFEDTVLVARIIGCHIALEMASFASKATMCRFKFQQAMIEAPVKEE
jgi:hypothetical protein